VSTPRERAERWFHEYGFVGPEDFESVLGHAGRQGFEFVYGGATKDEDWVGYPAALDRLEAEHAEVVKRANFADAYKYRQRAEELEQERDEAVRRSKLDQEQADEMTDHAGKLAGRVEELEGALRNINREWELNDGVPSQHLAALARAALASAAATPTTEEDTDGA